MLDTFCDQLVQCMPNGVYYRSTVQIPPATSSYALKRWPFAINKNQDFQNWGINVGQIRRNSRSGESHQSATSARSIRLSARVWGASRLQPCQAGARFR